eukprot:TRINITY_DN82759_c0_g1_i1.p1 TRINITY_DN82759_c0_g1~~TRINITY_DN82759_c0_g1_i1.p1  ORF type:complete len:389 (+),score=60.63 TRINITY_DN82759_c0_g1_i1:88-1167(+)
MGGFLCFRRFIPVLVFVLAFIAWGLAIGALSSSVWVRERNGTYVYDPATKTKKINKDAITKNYYKTIGLVRSSSFFCKDDKSPPDLHGERYGGDTCIFSESTYDSQSPDYVYYKMAIFPSELPNDFFAAYVDKDCGFRDKGDNKEFRTKIESFRSAMSSSAVLVIFVILLYLPVMFASVYHMFKKDPVPLLWLPLVTAVQSLLCLGVVISVPSSMPTGTLTTEDTDGKTEYDFDYLLSLGASWGIFIGSTACSFLIFVMTFMSYRSICKEKKREEQDQEVSSQYPEHSVGGYTMMPAHPAAQQPYSSYPPPQPHPYAGSSSAYPPPAPPTTSGAYPSPYSQPSPYPSTDYAPPQPGTSR